MSFSISVKLDAFGGVTVDVVDQAGGCPFTVACRIGAGGQDLLELSAEDAATRFADLLWSPYAHNWTAELREKIEEAVCQISQCLPSPDAFDEDGRPVRRKGAST